MSGYLERSCGSINLLYELLQACVISQSFVSLGKLAPWKLRVARVLYKWRSFLTSRNVPYLKAGSKKIILIPFCSEAAGMQKIPFKSHQLLLKLQRRAHVMVAVTTTFLLNKATILPLHFHDCRKQKRSLSNREIYLSLTVNCSSIP